MKQRLLHTALASLFWMAAAFATAQIPGPYGQQEQTISRTYTWQYDGRRFTHTFSFRLADYLYYRSLSKDQPYGEYCREYRGHPYLRQMAKELDDMAAPQGYRGRELAEFLLAFVRSITYQSDPTRSEGDWPKYTIESVLEQAADCEDFSQVFCSLASTLGFEVVLIDLPHHMAAGIACESCMPYYLHNGRRYGFVQTVPCDLAIGEVPAEYARKEAQILEVPHVAAYSRPTARNSIWQTAGQRARMPQQEDAIGRAIDEAIRAIISRIIHR